MKLKRVLSFLPFVFLVACSTLPHSEVTTSEGGEQRRRTLADVYGYIVRIASLDPEQMNKESIEAISDTSLVKKGGYYDNDFKIDDWLSIHLQMTLFSYSDVYFFIEFRPMLARELNQQNFNDYFAELTRLKPQIIRAHCIGKEQIFDSLFKSGWTPFETNLSPSLQDEEGNFYLSSEGGKYMTLTIAGNCLEQFTISKGTKHPAYGGIPTTTEIEGARRDSAQPIAPPDLRKKPHSPVN